MHSSIVSVYVTPVMEKRIYPRLNVLENYNMTFENELSSEYIVSSTGFYANVSQQGSTVNKLCFMEETSNNSLGMFYLDTNKNKVFIGNVGQINKINGTVSFNITATGFENDTGYVAILATPKDVDVLTQKYTTLSVDTTSDRTVSIDLKKVYRNSNQNVSSSNR
jgi:hypothetical protein